MREIEIKYIGAGSVFKFFGGIFMLVGLVVGLFLGLAGETALPSALKGIPFIGTTGPGPLSGIILGIFYGLAGGISYTIVALIYNFFAVLFGGIKIILKE